MRIANEGGRTLVEEVDLCPSGARWTSNVGSKVDEGKEMLHFWCNGSAGVGAFLLRLWQVTRNEMYLKLACAAGDSAYSIRGRAGTSCCHGLAGIGDFLLDLGSSVDSSYTAKANNLVDQLAIKSTIVDGRVLVLDEYESGVTLDYNTGLSGVLAFLGRLRYSRTRLWMPTEFLL